VCTIHTVEFEVEDAAGNRVSVPTTVNLLGGLGDQMLTAANFESEGTTADPVPGWRVHSWSGT
jgi:hypothetical protein